MAVTNGSKWTRLTASGEALVGPTRVTALVVVAGATGGATTITIDGTIFAAAVVYGPATTTVYNFSQGQDMTNITLTTAGTNVALLIYYI